jgi:hypothetical protein
VSAHFKWRECLPLELEVEVGNLDAGGKCRFIQGAKRFRSSGFTRTSGCDESEGDAEHGCGLECKWERQEVRVASERREKRSGGQDGTRHNERRRAPTIDIAISDCGACNTFGGRGKHKIGHNDHDARY